MEVTLKMSVEEANAILQVLGQLPTSSGAYPLLLKLKAQADEQVKPADAPAA